MRGMSTSARPRALGFLALFGVGVIAGCIAGSTACSAQGAEPTPAQIVNFRFPPGWNRVPAAPRSISYQRIAGVQKAGNPASAARAMAIDPNSAEVQRFKYAAFPLLMSFSEDQKREVRTLAHLMGLESVAAQF